MDITAVVASRGDGWLTVDTAEWIEDKLGDQDDQLTEDLNEWLGSVARGCWDAAGWARHRFPHVTGPSSDDDHPAVFNSANQDNLLSEDLCVMLMRVRDHDDQRHTLAVLAHRFVHVLSPAQEWSDVVDWARAYGNCPRGHTFILEAACYLHSDQDQGSYRLTDRCRLADDDIPYQGGYVACPDCDQPVHFTA